MPFLVLDTMSHPTKWNFNPKPTPLPKKSLSGFSSLSTIELKILKRNKSYVYLFITNQKWTMTSIVAPPQFSIEGTTSHSMHPTEGTTLSPSSLSLFIYNQSKMKYYIHVAPPQFKIEGTTSHSMHPTEGTSLHPPSSNHHTYLPICVLLLLCQPLW